MIFHPQTERINMPNYIEKIEKYTLPVIPVKSIIAFPGITLNFELTDKAASLAAKNGCLYRHENGQVGNNRLIPCWYNNKNQTIYALP